MNPFQKNKVDMNALTPEEAKAFRLYGKLPSRSTILKSKTTDRKYFDSGDYALSKAGKTSEINPSDVGREHPVPENIPHLSSSPSSVSQPASGALAVPPGSSTGGPGLERSGSVSEGAVVEEVPSGASGASGASTAGAAGGASSAAGGGAARGSIAGLHAHAAHAHRGSMSGSPVKEGSLLAQGTNIDEQDSGSGDGQDRQRGEGAGKGVPIRGARS